MTEQNPHQPEGNTILVHEKSLKLVKDIVNDEGIKPLYAMMEEYDKANDSYLSNHSYRVALLSADLGYDILSGENDMQLEDEDLVLLAGSGLLHDIGKIKVPKEIQNKQGKLTEEEQEIMHSHSIAGYDLLKDIDPKIAQIVIAVHEHKKKNPYPRNGKESWTNHYSGPERRSPHYDAANLAQIVSVSDIYDSLANSRPYKPKLSKSETEKGILEEYDGDPKYLEMMLLRIRNGGNGNGKE